MHDGEGKKIVLGWREWVSLPDLGIPAIKAKVDSGARTSALHAFKLETFTDNGRLRVRFQIHPLQRKKKTVLTCVADVIDYRRVSDSGGHHEMRYVISTPVRIGGTEFDVEITLTDRDTMQFRMLLGRTALAGRIIVDAGVSYRAGRKLRRAYDKKAKGRPL